MNRIEVILLGIACMCATVTVPGVTDYAESQKSYSQRLQEESSRVAAEEEPIEFYGKVIDHHGDPVCGATVLIQVGGASMGKRVQKAQVLTSLDGCFEYHSERASGLRIEEIAKPGYEFRRYQGMLCEFRYRKDYNPRHIPDRDSPVVFRVCKMDAEPTYLLHDPFSLGGIVLDEKRSYQWGYDAIKPFVISSDFERGKVDDIHISVSRLESSTKCIFTLTAEGGEEAGVYPSNEFLGMAPDSGYEPHYTFTAVRCPTGTLIIGPTGLQKILSMPLDLSGMHFYIRSRMPFLYSHFHIQGISVGSKSIRLVAQIYTNPLGDRNLEMDEQFPGAASSHIEAMVRKAYPDGVPLDVVPLKELIEAAKGTTKEESLRISREVRDLEDKVEREERRNFEIDTAMLTEMYLKAKKVKN
ncbi:MAG TPA: hypothetical protein PKH07_07080 [bacterium]|nr:hypothetical protein [bacterium]